MNDFESKVTAFLTERRKIGDGWTSLAELRGHVNPDAQSELGYSFATHVRLVPGIETRGGWALGQQFQVRMRESA